MINRKELLSDLQGLLKKIETDLLERSESSEVPDVGAKLREEYAAAQKAERTAQNFEDWRSDTITQAAVAWVLSCVFVRFLEDNELVETPKIAGPGERLKRARDEHEIYFRAQPTLNDRDFLLSVFDSLTKYAATKDVFGEHNPVRDLPSWLSGDAAGELIRFFQRVDPNTGNLVHDFSDAGWDTRFLGDLYQDLSEAARKKYALLQTPVFVEEFILDRTLEPALEEFGLAKPGYGQRLEPDGRLQLADRFKMIDPACGSGHFLLGSFSRLVERWRKREPGAHATIIVQRALDSVYGIDLNPYAVAISRFRLLLAAIKECETKRLSGAPGFVLHLACGDSLLHGSGKDIQQHLGWWDPLAHVYQPEDAHALQRMLCPKSYHAVVANPPYITPKDRALNEAYRERYSACHMKYSLAVPFLERIFSLAVDGGFTGQITANSFMKREFGKKVVEQFISKIDLTHVIDTKGAFIPGHATPTVILLGRNRLPVASTVRALMGIRGEPETPRDPALGKVWSAILSQIDEPGSESAFMTAADLPRSNFSKHPWSIGGGGAADLKEFLDNEGALTLNSLVGSIGIASFTLEDDAYILPLHSAVRRRIPRRFLRVNVMGDSVRDWQVFDNEVALFPYDELFEPLDEYRAPHLIKHLWSSRTTLANNRMFAGKTKVECGLRWYEYGRLTAHKLKTPRSIVFANIASHIHACLDEGGSIFNTTSPLIKLHPDAGEDEYLSILAYVNSSTACFWMKQVSQEKQMTGGESVRIESKAKVPYAFSSTQLGCLPVPAAWRTGPLRVRLVANSRRLTALAASLRHLTGDRAIITGLGSNLGIRGTWEQIRTQRQLIRSEMIWLQEEIDFTVYVMWGLADGNTLSDSSDFPEVSLDAGDRPFSMISGRNEDGFLVPSLSMSSWPDALRQKWHRRIGAIEGAHELRLIEDPHYKRRWIGRQGKYNLKKDEEGLEAAAAEWLMLRLESYLDIDGRLNETGTPTAKLPVCVVTLGSLADLARQDPQFCKVGAVYRNDEAFDVTTLVSELVESESIPLLPILRYKPSGLRKRIEWENTWNFQRQEDAIDARTKLPKEHPQFLEHIQAVDLKDKQAGKIPLPPKYTSADFLRGDYWRLRGKLDVPKERWVSFPYCEGEDGTLMVAWAGYDHLQLTTAISEYYVAVKERLGGREDPRLVPLLACLVELLPWLKQWHNELSPEFGVPMGDYFEGFIQEEAKGLGLTLEQVRAWQPPERARGGGTKKLGKKAAVPVEERI